MFYDGHRRLICEAFCSAEPQVAPQAALSPFGEPVRYVRSADAQPEVSRRSRARSQTHNSRALCSAVWPNGERAVYWDAVLPRIWAICALLPPFFGLFVHTRRDTHTCMQCAAACGCLEERERRERAIPLVFYATAARMFGGGRVQNSGPLSSHVMFLGV